VTALPLPVESPAIIEHLDEDWAIPCERKRHNGDASAEWIAWSFRCCPKMLPSILYCSPCKDEALRLMATYDRYCPHCGYLFAPAATVIRLIEPLNRRTT
jgi:hypothetical protein